jgi:integrase
MPLYPLPPHIRPDQLPAFTSVITDPTWLARYLDTVHVASKQGVVSYTSVFTRVYEVLEPGAPVLRTLTRLRRNHLHKRRGHVLRAVRLAETAPCHVVLAHFLRWDRDAHRRHRRGTAAWAGTLRDRLMLWILMLAGPRISNLVALRVGGPDPNLRMERGHATNILLRESETKNNRRVEIPLAPGIAKLLSLYVHEGRPRLMRDPAVAGHRLFLRDNGRPVSKDSFRRAFHDRLCREAFGGLPVYVHYLRRMAVALLRDGFQMSFAAIATILGHTEDTCQRVYYVFTPQAATAEYRRSLMGESPRAPEVEAVVAELKEWLRELADDLPGTGAG